MKKRELFPSKYMAAEDLQGKPWSFKISRIRLEEMHNKETNAKTKKGVVYFAGPKKGLILSSTIFDQIVEATGQDDTDNWPGHLVTIYPTTTYAFGNNYHVVRVRPAESKPSEVPAELAQDDDELADFEALD